ncbi:hypothetical protein [Escherichia phage Es2]|nr:hypothetical protein [Escherichia phage Es2]
MSTHVINHAPTGETLMKLGVSFSLYYLNIFNGNICVQDDTPVAAHLLGWHNTFF